MLALADPAFDLADPRSGLADPDDLAGELERALGGLRPEYRLVFVLFHSQHLSYDEIALVVKRPIGTVKTWLHRTRAQLAEELSKRGITR
jgi:DNA-directed RNA polymerase specialized sigma24 family protein